MKKKEGIKNERKKDKMKKKFGVFLCVVSVHICMARKEGSGQKIYRKETGRRN